MAEKLFYILFYCKCYPTFDVLSVVFNFDRSCAWDWVHGLLPVLEQALGDKQALPARKVHESLVLNESNVSMPMQASSDKTL